MNRRGFLRSALSVGVATGLFLIDKPFRPHVRLAQAGTGKTLISIFQRGGCDGLNVLVPYGEDEYYNLRPSIGIAPPSPGNPESALDLDGFFGLHPSLDSFIPLYNSGVLAILPTVQYPNSSHSHFSGEVFIESGAPVNNIDGWLNRHLTNHPHTDQLRAISFGSDVSQALRGDVFVSSFNDINRFNLGVGGEAEASLVARLLGVYNQDPVDPSQYRQLVQNSGRTIFNDMDVLRNIDFLNYLPENGAAYPNDRYGRQLMQIAQLIKSGVGLETATVNIGGWDTHNVQGGGNPDGRQARQLRSFSEGIAALYTDLGTRMSDVVILTMTEFGRTAKQNGSDGTDHGDASCWFALGGGVQGGIYGAWPGLLEAQLARGRYLQFTVDYRDVMGDILTQHLGNSQLDTLLPGHVYNPVGLFAG